MVMMMMMMMMMVIIIMIPNGLGVSPEGCAPEAPEIIGSKKR